MLRLAHPGLLATPTRKRSKYSSVACVDSQGRRHASGAEARRWAQLQLLEKAGAIQDLKHQPKFDLVVNGQLIARYIGDASYVRDGVFTVEDTKSSATKTAVYRIKFKLMLACHGIMIAEHMESSK